MKQIPALGAALCAAALSAATKRSRRPLFLFALSASVMMLQNARAQTAADYFNTGTPIGSIYNSFIPTSLCWPTFGLGRGHGRLPLGYLRPGKLGLRFARVLCSETGETPVPAGFADVQKQGDAGITPAELNAGGYSFNQTIGASPGYDFASIKAASDFYNAPKPISAVDTLYRLALAALRF